MIADVFGLEMLRADRRPRYRFACRAYAGWLMLQFATLYLDYFSKSHVVSPVEFVDGYLQLLFRQQLLLILLGVPVFVAGAITEEKSRGTLQDLLTTDLSSASIVLGKLLAGMAQGGRVLLLALPIVCFLGSCSAFDVPRIAILAGATLATLFAWSAVSILVSVWTSQTRRAILALYLLAAAAFALPTGLDWIFVNLLPMRLAAPGSLLGNLRAGVVGLERVLAYLDPSFLFEPAKGLHDGVELGLRLTLSGLLWLAIGTIAAALAVWRLRPACRRQFEAGERPPGRIARWLRRHVSDDPVRWKEQHVEGIAPLPVLRAVPTWAGAALIAILTLYLVGAEDAAPVRGSFGAAVLLLATLAVAVRASSAVSGERERQTWEAVLLTPLAIRRLIASKLRGIVAATVPYLAAFAIPALGVTIYRRDWDGVLYLAVWLFATVVAIHFVGAAGIWCSARARSSWMALLSTLGVGYFGGGAVALFGVPVVTIAVFYFWLFLSPLFIVLNVNPTASGPTLQVVFIVVCCLGVAAVFFKFAAYFILQAERLVLKERTPFWKSGFNCGYALEQYMQGLGESSRELEETDALPPTSVNEDLPFAEPVAPR